MYIKSKKRTKPTVALLAYGSSEPVSRLGNQGRIPYRCDVQFDTSANDKTRRTANLRRSSWSSRQGKDLDLMADRRAQEASEKVSSERERGRHDLFFLFFHLAVARSAARSFSLAACNCLERALRRRFRSKLNKTTLTASETTVVSALSIADRSTQ